jgi:hypothetical protein
MAINFSNVNISLRQFHEIASGKYNAGDIKLTSETEIDKANNHELQQSSDGPGHGGREAR